MPAAKPPAPKFKKSPLDISDLEAPPPVPPPRVLDSSRFKISATGDDALLNFGKYRGSTLSQLVLKDPSYLVWMLEKTETIPDDLLNVVAFVLGNFAPHSAYSGTGRRWRVRMAAKAIKATMWEKK